MIVLRDVEQMSVTDVADTLGIAAATVKARTYRARLRLRQRLSSFMERDHRHPHSRRHEELHMLIVDAQIHLWNAGNPTTPITSVGRQAAPRVSRTCGRISPRWSRSRDTPTSR